jgi:hypothetical protein
MVTALLLKSNMIFLPPTPPASNLTNRVARAAALISVEKAALCLVNEVY